MPVYTNTIYFQIMIKLIFFKIEIEIEIFKMPFIQSINLKNMNEFFFRTFFPIFKLIKAQQIFNIFQQVLSTILKLSGIKINLLDLCGLGYWRFVKFDHILIEIFVEIEFLYENC